MQAGQELRFGSFRLAPEHRQLHRGQQEVNLTPKALGVLCVLVARSGQVVTKEEFFQAVWPQTVVSDDALTTCILELRQALRDDAKKPRYIETVHRRGYRFIAPVVAPAVPVLSSEFPVAGQEEGVSRQQEERQKENRRSKSERQIGRHFLTSDCGPRTPCSELQHPTP